MKSVETQNQHLPDDRFRLYLQSELDRRCRENPSYSLRAFARSLKIHASCLSVMLKGKRPITVKMFNRFSSALNLGPQERLKFIGTQDSEHSFIEYETLELDAFAISSEWYHDAILELARLKEFRSDPNWIAKVLEIPVPNVHSALERLTRCRFIKLDSSGNIELLKPDTQLFVNQYTTSALKRYQADSLEKSKRALEEVGIDRRYHSTFVMAIPDHKLDEAKQELRKVREKFCEKLQRDPNDFNDVYQLNVSFYPITRLKKESDKEISSDETAI